MVKTDTSGGRRRNMVKALAVGAGILVGSLAGWGEGWAQGSASRGMPAPSGSVQSGGQITVPGYRRDHDRDGDRDRDRYRDYDRDRYGYGDRHRHYPPYVGYYGQYYPSYGYYYYPPYGTYQGRWVWDGRNWLFVPLY